MKKDKLPLIFLLCIFAPIAVCSFLAVKDFIKGMNRPLATGQSYTLPYELNAHPNVYLGERALTIAQEDTAYGVGELNRNIHTFDGCIYNPQGKEITKAENTAVGQYSYCPNGLPNSQVEIRDTIGMTVVACDTNMVFKYKYPEYGYGMFDSSDNYSVYITYKNKAIATIDSLNNFVIADSLSTIKMLINAVISLHKSIIDEHESEMNDFNKQRK